MCNIPSLPCSLALCCEDALRLFHYCFPTHIWVSTAQQQHWCWSFSWLRWRALPTPEGGYHFQISKPNRELPSLGFSNHVTSSFSVMHLLSCNLLPIQVFCCVLRIPAILRRAMGFVSCSVFFLECAMSKWKHDIGEVTLYDYTFLWWMEERNQLLGAATEFQKLIANYSKLLYF